MQATKWLTAPAAAALSIVLAVPAPATPGYGVSGVILSQATVDGHDYITREITIDPGGSTGWHWHDGQLYGVIMEGTLTHYRSDCSIDGVYDTGQPVIEEGSPDNIHVGRNMGTTPLVMRIVYVDPAGSPLSQDAPDPGCGFA